MAEPLQISLLGNIRIIHEGVNITGEIPVKAQAMLAYLAVTGEEHTRQALAGLLWGDSPEKKALTSLRVTLNRLRKLLPDTLTVSHLTIGFNHDADYQLDIDQFSQADNGVADNNRATGDTAALRSVMDLYRGDFLADFFLDDAAEYEAWLLSTRAHFQQLALQRLQALTDLLLAERNYSSAVQVLTRRIAIEPWSEEAHRELMLTYSRMGDFNAGLAQYDKCSETLMEELGVDPMPETDALYERIHSARAERPHNLPAESTPFIGRATEMTQALNLLTNPGLRLVTIVGLGGMGKTRLALEIARQAVQEQAALFLNGVAFISLVGVQAAESVPLLIADALKLALPGQSQPLNELVDHLRNREVLLVLDNFEQLVDSSSELLRTLLDDCPDVKFLITSREPLNLATEWRLDLSGLAYPPVVEADEEADTESLRPFLAANVAGDKATNGASPNGLTAPPLPLDQYGAVQLFVQTAQQVQPHFQLDEVTTPSVRRISQLTVGMPLALKLAAAWLRTMSIQQIVEEASHNLDILSSTMRDVPQRHRSMRAIIDYTWQLLAAEEQTAFNTLAIFRSGFTDEAVRTVANASPHLLAGLVDRSLLQVSFTSTGMRYSLHELLRQFGEERLAEDPEQEEARTRHARFYLDFLADRSLALHGEGQQHALEEVSREIDNVREAWQWTVRQRQWSTLSAVLDDLYRFFWTRSQAQSGRTLFVETLDALQREPDSEQEQLAHLHCRLTAHCGMFSYFLGDYEQAKQQLHASLQQAQALEMERTAANALNTLGAIAAWQGEHDGAQQYLRSSLDIWRVLEDESGAADALHELAQINALSGDYEQARRYSEESLVLCQRLGRADWTGFALDTLGWATFALGDYDAARTAYTESLTAFEGISHQLGVSLALGGIGSVEWARGGEHLSNARQHMERSVVICREIGHQPHLASRLWYLAQIANDQEQHEEARRYGEEGLAVARSIGNAVLTGFNLCALGTAAAGRGNFAHGRQQLEEALRITFQEKLLPPMCIALYAFAALLAEEGDLGVQCQQDGQVDSCVQALAALDLLREHPAGWHVVRERATQLRATLIKSLPDEVVATATERAQSRTLESLMAELLHVV